MTGVKQTPMESILCRHLFCTLLEIHLLPGRLMSTNAKSSGQTVFSVQETEFTFQ